MKYKLFFLGMLITAFLLIPTSTPTIAQDNTRNNCSNDPNVSAAGASTCVELELTQPVTIDRETLAVGVYFSVLDVRDGRRIPDIEIETATLELNGQEYLDEEVTQPRTPIYIALLLDVSGSMRANSAYITMKEAAISAIENATEGSLFATVPFDNTPSLATFVFRSRGEAQGIISSIGLPENKAPTCIYDTTYLALEQLSTTELENQRRSLVVFTDGKDENSDGNAPCSRIHNVNDVITFAQANEIAIHTIGMQTDKLDEESLRRMANETGGIYVSGDQDVLPELFEEIIRILNSQWLARFDVYTPEGEQTARLYVNLKNGLPMVPVDVVFTADRDYLPPPGDVSIVIDQADISPIDASFKDYRVDSYLEITNISEIGSFDISVSAEGNTIAYTQHTVAIETKGLLKTNDGLISDEACENPSTDAEASCQEVKVITLERNLIDSEGTLCVSDEVSSNDCITAIIKIPTKEFETKNTYRISFPIQLSRDALTEGENLDITVVARGKNSEESLFRTEPFEFSYNPPTANITLNTLEVDTDKHTLTVYFGIQPPSFINDYEIWVLDANNHRIINESYTVVDLEDGQKGISTAEIDLLKEYTVVSKTLEIDNLETGDYTVVLQAIDSEGNLIGDEVQTLEFTYTLPEESFWTRVTRPFRENQLILYILAGTTLLMAFMFVRAIGEGRRTTPALNQRRLWSRKRINEWESRTQYNKQRLQEEKTHLSQHPTSQQGSEFSPVSRSSTPVQSPPLNAATRMEVRPSTPPPVNAVYPPQGHSTPVPPPPPPMYTPQGSPMPPQPSYPPQGPTPKGVPTPPMHPIPNQERASARITVENSPNTNQRGTQVQLMTLPFTMGRQGQMLNFEGVTGVSTAHAQIIYNQGQFFIVDRQSTNGTFVNNQRVGDRHPLSHGDEIKLGKTVVLRFEIS